MANKKFLSPINLVNLASDPSSASEGDIYYDTTSDAVKVYANGAWVAIGAGGGITVSTTAPSSPTTGDAWYKNDTGEFYVYDGTYWVEVNGVVSSNGFTTISVSGEDNVVADSSGDTLTLIAGTNVTIETNATNDSITINADSKATSSVYLVRNNTGSTILKGTLVSASGAEPSGRIDVEPFAAVGGINSEITVMGMATTNISNGVNGEVISFGTLTGLDTRGDTTSAIAVGDETWAAGDILFAHPTVAGKLTNVRPQHDLAVAFITVRHASTGQIAVRIVPGNNHLEWMHDVTIDTPADNEVLAYDTTTSQWINQTYAEAGIQSVVANVTDTEIGYLDGVTSSIQTQITGKQDLNSTLTSLSSVGGTSGFFIRSGLNTVALDQTSYASLAGATFTGGINGTDITLSGDLQVNGSDITTTSTTFNIGNSNTAVSPTTNISTVATASGQTKTLNIGTEGASGSTTNINLGSVAGGTVTVNKDLVVSGNLTVDGTTTTVNSTTVNVQNAFVFEGATADTFETTLTIIDPTADNTISLPDATGTVALTSDLTAYAPLEDPTFTGTVSLPALTSIGIITKDEIALLTGLTENVQYRLTSLTNSVGTINTDLGSKADLVSGTLNPAQLPAEAATTSYVATNFQASSSKNIANGYAGLDANAKVLAQYLDLTTVAPLVSPTFTGTVVLPSTTSIGDVSATEVGYLNGVTSSIQDQIDSKLGSTAAQSLYLAITDAVDDYQPIDADLTNISALSTTGIVVRGAGSVYTTITDNSSNWDAAYTDINKWDGGSTGLNAGAGRTSLGLVIGTDVQAYSSHLAGINTLGSGTGFLKNTAGTWSYDNSTYSTTEHNHTLDSLSNVVITGTPTDGQAIVWDTTTSKWVNETVSGGGGASYPTQTGNNGKFLQTDGTDVSWAFVDLSSYLTSESDTLETVTDRGATSTNAITISNATQSTTPTSGALIISGGVGIAKDVWIDGDLHVNGTTITENTKTVATSDNLIYLNSAQDTEITNAVGDGTYVTYTAENKYVPGMDIRVTGMDPVEYNISSADGLTVYSATSTEFVVEKTDTGTFVSGGIGHAKEEVNPDLGFAGGYYNEGYAHAGLFRDASDGVFKFFQGYIPEPDEAVNIDTTHASFALATIAAKSISSSYAGNFGIGYETFIDATPDNQNFSIGTQASYLNTGFANYGIGNGALSYNSGDTNFVFGSNAGFTNSGNDNYGIGIGALSNNTGNSNSGFGNTVLSGNSGTSNFGIGDYALSGNTGDYNYAFGYNPGYSNTGDNNLFIGTDTGIFNSGNYNVYIGKSSGLSTSNNIVIADNEGNLRAQYLSADSGWTLGTIYSATWNGTEIGYAYGGTGLTTLGTAGQVLTVNAGATALEWADASGGGSSFTNSSELAALLSDETGSGSVVFSNSPTLTTPNIGAATGTSLTTTGNVVYHIATVVPTLNAGNGHKYTLVLSDDGDIIEMNTTTGEPNTLEIPPDSAHAFPIGTQITVLQVGAGQTTIAGGAGVTVNATPGLKLRATWSSASLIKRATDTWVVIGDLTV